MSKGLWTLLLVSAVWWLASCRQHDSRPAGEEDPAKPVSDTLATDSLDAEPEESEEEMVYTGRSEQSIDRSFNDFFFAFVHNHRLQRKRTRMPLDVHLSTGEDVKWTRHPDLGLQYFQGDFYTVLYADPDQIEDTKAETPSETKVQRIDLDGKEILTYFFQMQKEKWMLDHIRYDSLRHSPIADFLHFYAEFSSDSIFQMRHVAPRIHISIYDEDGSGSIEGTIDALQWAAFRPEIPCGIISHIDYGQPLSERQMVLQKCGMANGMEEIFTFHKLHDQWKLTSYEN